VIKFIPDSPFSAYKTYVITASSSILDVDGVALLDTYTSVFKTGNTFDNEPPVNGSFIINDGAAVYTGKREVSLNNIFADDDSEIPFLYVYNENDEAPTLFDFSSSLSWTLSADDGEKTVNIKFEDQIGNLSPDPAAASIILDTTAPGGTVSISGGALFTASSSVDLTLSATDPAAGTMDGSGMASGTMTISNDASFSDASPESYAESKAGWTLPSASDGTKTVHVRFADALGNESTETISASIYLDRTAPTGTVNGGATVAVNTADVTVTLELSDGAGSGVDTVQLISGAAASGTWTSSSGNSGSLSSGAFASATPAAASFGFPIPASDGNKVLTFRVWDKLANHRDISGTIRYDTTPPTLTSISINGGAAETNSTSVTVTLNGASDANSGTVTHVGLANDAGFTNPTWIPYGSTVAWTLEEGDGSKTVYAKVRDAAGNVSASAVSASVTLDTAAPEGGFVVAGNATFTKTTAVTLNSSADGAAEMRFSNDGTNWPNGWVLYNPSVAWTLPSGDGTKTVYGQYRDAVGGGNVGSVVTDTIILDTVAPTGAITILGTGDGTNAYTNTLTVGLSLSASDATSGIYRMSFSLNGGSTWTPWETYTTTKTGVALANPSGNVYTVQVKFVDKAGNESTSVGDTIVYDNVAPVVSSFALNGGVAWTNSGVMTLNTAVSEALSGTYQLSVSNTSSTSGFSAWETYNAARTGWTSANPTTEGSKQVWLKVRDRAGNESAVVSDTIGLDLTPPTISSVAINAGAATTPSLQAQVTINSSDSGGSGLAQYQQYYNGSYGAYKTLSGGSATVKIDWPFTTNAGAHYIYVNVKDAAGNVSSWASDLITLEVPTMLYAMKGVYSGGYTYVYGSTAQAPTGTNTYYIYSTTNGAANPNVDASGLTLVGSASGSTYTYPNNFQAYATSTAGELRYFFVRAYNSTTGGYGPYSAVSVPGWSAHVTIVYNANDSVDTALAQSIKTSMETNLPAAYPTSISGTQLTRKAILIPESMVSTAFVAGTTTEAYYRHVIYGDPTIVTPATSLYANANKTRNLVSGTRGVVGMGNGGTRLIDTVNSYWSTWGMTGQQPTNIGYLNSAVFSDSTINTYSYNASNTVWVSPLVSTSLSGTDGQVQLSYSTAPMTTRYSVYRKGGAVMTGGWLYARETGSIDYFPVAHQGRFLHYGYSSLPNRPYTGAVFLMNLIERMDDY